MGAGPARAHPARAGSALTGRRRVARPAAQLDLPASDPAPRIAWAGPFRPTLEAAWLATLARWRAADPLGAVWLLVPSRFLGLHLLRLAARAGGAVNVHVLTFTELAARLSPSDAPARRLPPAGDLVVIRQALREAVPPDGYLAAVRDARRFPAALASTLAELRTAGIQAPDLERVAGEATNPASGAKLRELARIVERAEAALSGAGFAHPTDALWAAADHVHAGGPVGPCAGLVAYGFTDWNAAERALLGEVSARVPTTCAVPAEPGPPFGPLERLLDWLSARGFQIERPAVPVPRGPGAIVARLFHEAAGGGADTDGLRIIAAPGEEREVREVARELLAAAAAGIPFDAMGVLIRQPETYRSAVRDVFAAAGIPYTWGVAPSLAETRAGRTVRLLLAARREGFARAPVLEFLAVAPLRDGRGIEPAEWDRLSREAGIVGGAGDWRAGLGRLAWRARAASGTEPSVEEPEARTARAPSAAVVEALGRVVGQLLDSAGPLPDAAPAAELGRRLLRAFLRLCRRDPDVEEVAAVLAGFEALVPLTTPLGLDEFAELLDEALSAPTAPGPESRQGKVFVAPLHQALGLPFRVLVLPGLVEQGFPAPMRSDPVLLDDERAGLHRLHPEGRPGLALASERAAEERLAFRLAATGAQERLILTYPRVDTPSGRARVPSFFLLRVAEAATGLPHDFSRLDAFPPHLRVPLVPAPPGALAAPLDRREWLLAQAALARPAGAAGRAACLALAGRAARGRAALEARERGNRVTVWDGLLPRELGPVLAAWHRPAGAPLAATPLEHYAACPFRYYLAHVLGITPAIEPERVLTIAAADRGLLLHAVLARAYAGLREAALLPLTAERLPAAEAVLANAFGEVEARFGALGLAPFWRGERARLLADLGAAIRAEAREAADWVPTEFEASFGDAEAGLAVQHALARGETLTFRGRVDRLDVSADGRRARVIDYKSGRPRPDAAGRLSAGTALQLPIYRLAAEVLCRARGLDCSVEDAQYYHLTRRGERRRVRFTAADWETRRPEFDRALEAILDGIAGGHFFQNPTPEGCRQCDYQLACAPPRERAAWVEQKRDDPVRAAYASLGEIR